MTQQITTHSAADDAQGIAFGSFMAAFGVALLTHLGLITGQTAGLAILIAYATGWSFGAVFFVVNIPFYWLGYRRFGLSFTIKTFAAVLLTSVLAGLAPGLIQFAEVDPVFGAILAGAVCGTGLLALFRHGASLGGVGIVALYLQDATGFRAGWAQLIFDALLFAAALFVIDWQSVGYSFLGAVVLNMVIAINHRRDRYIA
ncbi:YitT family protein [Paracoccus tegillarcae]|uniref:YitT family protein n=1 Tax=Paracoccus tegillarcae TaxID=1529068 RepID=A0A2K9EK92_9RHOB|nr:YitT family protein [Paracoccus tegillarcae]AUH34819.1 YitT family protein [Paracoccus tegillarcae]